MKKTPKSVRDGERVPTNANRSFARTATANIIGLRSGGTKNGTPTKEKKSKSFPTHPNAGRLASFSPLLQTSLHVERIHRTNMGKKYLPLAPITQCRVREVRTSPAARVAPAKKPHAAS